MTKPVASVNNRWMVVHWYLCVCHDIISSMVDLTSHCTMCFIFIVIIISIIIVEPRPVGSQDLHWSVHGPWQCISKQR